MLLIPRYGMEGAAAATAISAFVYSFLRFVFIYQKFKLQPYGLKTFLIVLLIAGGFGVNYILPAVDNRILDILYRSVVVTLFYGAGTYLFRIVPEFHKYLGLKIKD
jgi:O-antigen/teichoic acid export membrane protein